MQHPLQFSSSSKLRRIHFAALAGIIAALTGSLFALSFKAKGVTTLIKYRVAPQTAFSPALNLALKGVAPSLANTDKTGNEGANSWTINGLTTSIVALAIDPQNPSTLYAAIDCSVYKTTTGGASWSPINNSILACIYALAIDPQNPSTLYAGGQRGIYSDGGQFKVHGIYKSTNSGASWGSINSGLPAPLDGEVISAIAIDPQNPSTLYMGTNGKGTGVYKSATGGSSWGLFSNGLTNLSVSVLAITPSGQTLHAGTGGGVFSYTYDGKNCVLSYSATVPATTIVGTATNFSGTATPSNCSGTPTYEWDFGDGTAKSTQQNPSHTYAFTGKYDWKMRATIAGVTFCMSSGSIEIKVGCIASGITTQPANKQIPSGGTTTLSVIANGTAPLSYQWYEGAKGDTSKPVGTNSNTFTTPSLTSAKSYWVRVNNACGNADK